MLPTAHGGDTDNGIVQLYAGLLPGTDVGAGTDLGAPIADDTQDGAWTGTLAGYDITGNPITRSCFPHERFF